ncbi:hypothetical protein CEXT_270331 [Caerostris extrusa]|uniref:Uncharacterized protein n=1 Tax=Caerostris extrusa TaxID=172846 RepID=A0AAV4S7K0_CAEEX|nr:hypothetical protein CEXT_270331 [Caerostris extrusa]
MNLIEGDVQLFGNEKLVTHPPLGAGPDSSAITCRPINKRSAATKGSTCAIKQFSSITPTPMLAALRLILSLRPLPRIPTPYALLAHHP